MTSKSKTVTRSALAILTLILMAALTSCRTSQPSADDPLIVTEYRYLPIPAVSWPEFPDPKGQVERLPDGRVVMPLTYWLAVTRYVIDAESGIYIIEAARQGSVK